MGIQEQCCLCVICMSCSVFGIELRTRGDFYDEEMAVRYDKENVIQILFREDIYNSVFNYEKVLKEYERVLCHCNIFLFICN